MLTENQRKKKELYQAMKFAFRLGFIKCFYSEHHHSSNGVFPDDKTFDDMVVTFLREHGDLVYGYLDPTDDIPKCKICGEDTTHNRESSFFGSVHRFGPTDHTFTPDKK